MERKGERAVEVEDVYMIHEEIGREEGEEWIRGQRRPRLMR